MFKILNIMKIFFEEPNREFNVREVARITEKTPATISKKLKELNKKDLIKYRKERILDLYKANLESDNYKDLKKYYSIKKIRDSGLIESLNIFYLKPTIILFGSASYGLDTETSDIDLVIISENTKDFPEKKDFEKKINKSLQLFVVKELKDLKNKHLTNNVLNGILLQGQIQWT